MSELRIDEGSGSFVFRDAAAGARGSMRVFSSGREPPARDVRIVIAMHGLDRAAAAFRDVLVGAAEQYRRLMILVPEFDAAAFPDAYAYNYGNVVAAPPETAIMPRSAWTFGIVDRLFAGREGGARVRAGDLRPVRQFGWRAIRAALSRAQRGARG